MLWKISSTLAASWSVIASPSALLLMLLHQLGVVETINVPLILLHPGAQFCAKTLGISLGIQHFIAYVYDVIHGVAVGFAPAFQQILYHKVLCSQSNRHTRVTSGRPFAVMALGLFIHVQQQLLHTPKPIPHI